MTSALRCGTIDARDVNMTGTGGAKMTETVSTLVTEIVGLFNDLSLFPFIGATIVVGAVGALVAKLLQAGK